MGWRASGRRAFSVVELLVVVGIVALLTAILLPVLNRVRQSAQTVTCLSNLRQIGQGINHYASTQKGYLLPYRTLPDGPHWVNVLIEGHYLPGNGVDDLTDLSAQKSANVFRCPAGNEQMLTTTPSGYFDTAGGNFVRMVNTSTNKAVDVWYGVNGSDGSPFETDGLFDRYPFRTVPAWRASSTTAPDDTRLKRLSDITHGADLALVFDGVLFTGNNPYMINARHQRNTITNILMADGHAESVAASTLPAGMLDDPNSTAQSPFPRWRMDQ